MGVQKMMIVRRSRLGAVGQAHFPRQPHRFSISVSQLECPHNGDFSTEWIFYGKTIADAWTSWVTDLERTVTKSTTMVRFNAAPVAMVLSRVEQFPREKALHGLEMPLLLQLSRHK